MFRLSVLGQLDLRDATGADVRPVLAQPKRMALLVYLAASRPQRFHRRDALLPLFWPELAESPARNALRQSLHQLRLSLGPDIVVSRGADSLSVDPVRLSCDVVDFENALDRGQLTDALALYGGDLLPGMSIAGAAAFDEWIDETRMRLRHRAARAAWAQAEQQERAGMLDAAAVSARLATTLTLDDEPALRQLVALLDRIGDHAGAIRAYEEYAARLRRELDVEPAQETRRLIETVRSRRREQAQGSARPVDDSTAVRSPHAPAHRSPRTGSERTQVIVSAFENLSGDPALEFVGRLAATAVAQGLAETRLVHVVTGDAAEGGARARAGANGDDALIVDGSFLLIDDAFSLRVSLRDADGRSVGTIAAVHARRERPWEGAHELSQRVSGAVAGHLDPNVASWADAVSEPPSFEAHRGHLLGMELHLRGDYRAAISQFLRAANPEQGFTVPMLWAIQASCNLEEYEQAAAIHGELAAHRSRLAPAEQLGCDYFDAWLMGDRGSAHRILRRIAELLPDSEVLAQLGRDALFLNHPRFAVETLERVDPERGWMPSWAAYWRRLTEAYHILGEHARESVAARRGRVQHPEAVGTLLYEARAHAALGDMEAVHRAVDEAEAMGSDRFTTAGEVLHAAAQECRAHGHRCEGNALLTRAIDWQLYRCGGELSNHADRLTLARMYHEAERWSDAGAILKELRRERPDDVDVFGCIGTLAARQGDVASARTALAALKAKTGRFHFGRHLLWAARIAAVLGDANDAITHLRGAFARGLAYGVELHTDVDLAALAGDGRYEQLLRPKG
ncbi:MAG: BTAD domain-containing putative transcriptional regulator [Gemmatimonadaceae bacterium]